MTRQYDDKACQTLDAINRLNKDGINRISVLLRHSERFYSKDPNLEPFMGLTLHGKTLAHDFGAALPEHLTPILYSSFIGRCIETAYLIDKGNTVRYNHQIAHTQTQKMLSPYYIKNIKKVIAHAENTGNSQFLRDWFNKQIDTAIIDNPVQTADCLCQVMIELLSSLKEDQICLCISHDWNIYPLKEFKLGLAHETCGDVGYLEGILFFEKSKHYHIMGYDSDPVQIIPGLSRH